MTNFYMKINRAVFLKYLNLFVYFIVIVTIIVVPLVVDKHLLNLYLLPKQYFFGWFVTVGIVAMAIYVLASKQMHVFRTSINWGVIGFIVTAFVVSAMSQAGLDSWGGRTDYFVLNMVFIFWCVLWYVILTTIVTTARQWYGLVNALLATGAFSAIIFILSAWPQVGRTVTALARVPNTTDNFNLTFGIWLVVINGLALGMLFKKDQHPLHFILERITAFVSFAALLMMSFKMVWWSLLGALIFLLVIGISFWKDVRRSALMAVGIMSGLVLIIIIFDSPRTMQAHLVPELVLGPVPSWTVVRQTILAQAKNAVFGSGLGSFGVDFSRFRPASFNRDVLTWSLRFNQPFSSLLALMAEGGGLLTVAWLLMVLVVIGHIFFAWVKRHNIGRGVNRLFSFYNSNNNVEFFVVGFLWFVLTTASLFIFFGPVLWWLWWLLLALVVIGLGAGNHPTVKYTKVNIDQNLKYHTIFVMLVLLMVGGTVSVAVWSMKAYVAERWYAEAVRANDVATAKRLLQSALARHSDVDVYYATLSQVYATEAIQMNKINPANTTAVAQLMENAIASAREATVLSPQSALMWANLGTIYETATPLVPAAQEWAIKSLSQARDLEPTNPIIWWRLGNDFIVANQPENALAAFQQAITLKPDYVPGYAGITRVYEARQDYDTAIATYQAAAQIVPANVDIIYNWGRALFNRNRGNDRALAEKFWLEIIHTEPTYSNALYSLGLLNENRGNKLEALRYFAKVKELNPNNPEILKKINILSQTATSSTVK